MYYAHISDDGLRKQTVLEHLQGTSRLAGDFAQDFQCRSWGYGCGLLHDIGKYSLSFQKRLSGGPITDHATAGAKELYKRKNLMAAYCVAGHHSGLPDGGSKADAPGSPSFFGRMEKELPDYQDFSQEISYPDFSNPPLKPLGRGGFSLSFFIRMVYSCLVDADFLDTEEFMSQGTVPRGIYDSMDVLTQRLLTKVGPWLETEESNTINGRRTRILKACLEKGRDPQGLYQLTVPTGGGKTISSLAFALIHAQKHDLKRIIYVIPYTTIIEQNAQVFRDFLGKDNVLEDHSNVYPQKGEELDPAQLAAENWDKPVVVTTNVQFFESLFSSKSSKCRKLHNISKSIIIFDEAQMLPVKYLKPCIQAISELIYNYNCTAVLCTATQPALQEFFPPQIKAREICPDVREQYLFFKRTAVQNLGCISQEDLLEQIRSQTQCLCILNSRKRVRQVYEALKDDKTYLLSTFLYPEHRKRVLKHIRNRLDNGEDCRVIATSLVEAGVDLDFQTVYREIAGVDSVVQAAGRCNREGKRSPKECSTYVFSLEEDKSLSIPQNLKLPISVTRQVSEKYQDLSSPEAIHEYFRRLYHFKGEGLDGKNIVEMFERSLPSYSFPFQQADQEFRLIENDTVTILIDQEPEAAEIVRRIRQGEKNRPLIRQAGRYSINIYPNDFDNLYGAGRLEEIGLDFYVLRNKEQYTQDMGLVIDTDRGEAVIF